MDTSAEAASGVGSEQAGDGTKGGTSGEEVGQKSADVVKSIVKEEPKGDEAVKKENLQDNFSLVNIGIDETSGQFLMVQQDEQGLTAEDGGEETAFILMEDGTLKPAGGSGVGGDEGLVIQGEEGQQYIIMSNDGDKRQLMLMPEGAQQAGGQQIMLMDESGQSISMTQEQLQAAGAHQNSDQQYLIVQNDDAAGGASTTSDGNQLLLVQNPEGLAVTEAGAVATSTAISQGEDALKGAEPGTMILVQGEDGNLTPGTSMTPEEAEKVIQALQQHAQTDGGDTMVLLAPPEDPQQVINQEQMVIMPQEKSRISDDDPYNDPNDPPYDPTEDLIASRRPRKPKSITTPSMQTVAPKTSGGATQVSVLNEANNQMYVFNMPEGSTATDTLDSRIIEEILSKNIIKKGDKAIVTVNGRAFVLRVADKSEREKQASCEMCGEKCANPEQLREHRLKNHSKIYRCPKCFRVFDNADGIKGHRCGIRGPTPGAKAFKCDICDTTFTSKVSYDSHMNTHHGERPFKCQYCIRSFKDNSMLKTHIKTHVSEKPFTCTYCPKTFTWRPLAKAHERTHTEDKPYECDVCSKKFSQPSQLSQHRKTHAAEGSMSGGAHRCQLCPASFDQWQECFAHMQTHRSRKKCTECGELFADQAALDAHSTVHQKAESLTCDFCGKKFSNASSLFVHQYKHHDESKVVCSLCKLAFRDDETLEKHMLSHPEMSPKAYKCEVCKETFPKRAELIAHLKIHSGKQAYACPFCQTCCFSKDALILHVDNDHQEESPFTCRVCRVQFDKFSDLETHRKVHKRFACPYCSNKMYSQVSSLLDHVKAYHPETDVVFCEDCGKHFDDATLLDAHQISCAERNKKKGETTEREMSKDTRDEQIVNEEQGHSQVVKEDKQNTEDAAEEPDEILTEAVQGSDDEQPSNQGSDGNTHPCNVCGQTLASESELQEHYAKKHSSDTDELWLAKAEKEELELKERITELLAKGDIVEANNTQARLDNLISNTEEEMKRKAAQFEPVRKPSIVCPFCTLKFSSKGDLKVHIKTHIQKISDDSRDTEKTITPRKPLRDLSPHYESKFTFECNVCPKVFASEEKVRRHSKLHNPRRSDEAATEHIYDDALFKCTDCKTVCQSLEEVTNHWIDTHMEREEEESSSLPPTKYRRPKYLQTPKEKPTVKKLGKENRLESRDSDYSYEDSDEDSDDYRIGSVSAHPKMKRMKQDSKNVYTKRRLTPNLFDCKECGVQFKRLYQLKCHYRQMHGLQDHEIRLFTKKTELSRAEEERYSFDGIFQRKGKGEEPFKKLDKPCLKGELKSPIRGPKSAKIQATSGKKDFSEKKRGFGDKWEFQVSSSVPKSIMASGDESSGDEISEQGNISPRIDDFMSSVLGSDEEGPIWSKDPDPIKAMEKEKKPVLAEASRSPLPKKTVDVDNKSKEAQKRKRVPSETVEETPKKYAKTETKEKETVSLGAGILESVIIPPGDSSDEEALRIFLETGVVGKKLKKDDMDETIKNDIKLSLKASVALRDVFEEFKQRFGMIGNFLNLGFKLNEQRLELESKKDNAILDICRLKCKKLINMMEDEQWEAAYTPRKPGPACKTRPSSWFLHKKTHRQDIRRPGPASKTKKAGPLSQTNRPGPGSKMNRLGPASKMSRLGPASKMYRPGPASKINRSESANKMNRPGPASKMNRPGPASKMNRPGPASKTSNLVGLPSTRSGPTSKISTSTVSIKKPGPASKTRDTGPIYKKPGPASKTLLIKKPGPASRTILGKKPVSLETTKSSVKTPQAIRRPGPASKTNLGIRTSATLSRRPGPASKTMLKRPGLASKTEKEMSSTSFKKPLTASTSVGGIRKPGPASKTRIIKEANESLGSKNVKGKDDSSSITISDWEVMAPTTSQSSNKKGEKRPATETEDVKPPAKKIKTEKSGKLTTEKKDKPDVTYDSHSLVIWSDIPKKILEHALQAKVLVKKMTKSLKKGPLAGKSQRSGSSKSCKMNKQEMKGLQTQLSNTNDALNYIFQSDEEEVPVERKPDQIELDMMKLFGEESEKALTKDKTEEGDVNEERTTSEEDPETADEEKSGDDDKLPKDDETSSLELTEDGKKKAVDGKAPKGGGKEATSRKIFKGKKTGDELPPGMTYCTICNKNFMNKASLDDHMQTHDDVIVKCQMCPKTFKEQKHLDFHYIFSH